MASQHQPKKSLIDLSQKSNQNGINPKFHDPQNWKKRSPLISFLSQILAHTKIQRLRMSKWLQSTSLYSFHRQPQIPIRSLMRLWICWISCGNKTNKIKMLELQKRKLEAALAVSHNSPFLPRRTCVKSIKIFWGLSVSLCFQFTWNNSSKYASS